MIVPEHIRGALHTLQELLQAGLVDFVETMAEVTQHPYRRLSSRPTLPLHPESHPFQSTAATHPPSHLLAPGDGRAADASQRQLTPSERALQSSLSILLVTLNKLRLTSVPAQRQLSVLGGPSSSATAFREYHEARAGYTSSIKCYVEQALDAFGRDIEAAYPRGDVRRDEARGRIGKLVRLVKVIAALEEEIARVARERTVQH